LEALKLERPNISISQYELQYWADAQLSVKQLFFNFLLQTLGDYTPFLRMIDPKRNKNMLSSSDFFDFEGFLEWHR
jgi:hypothetical protein